MPSGKKEEESSGGGNEWLNTYADMVTLLLTFFVLLFASSNLSAEKFKMLVSAFNGSPIVIIDTLDPSREIIEGVKPLDRTPVPTPTKTPSPSTTPPPDNVQAVTVAEQFDDMYLQLQHHIRENGLDESVSVSRDGDIVVVRFADSALFSKGDATLREEAYPIVYEIAQLLERSIASIKSISVEGHTDNIPINTEKYPDNRALSSDRAVQTVRYIEQVTNIDPAMLLSVGRSEYYPIDTNDTEVGKARNRRVEFVIERNPVVAE